MKKNHFLSSLWTVKNMINARSHTHTMAKKLSLLNLQPSFRNSSFCSMIQLFLRFKNIYKCALDYLDNYQKLKTLTTLKPNQKSFQDSLTTKTIHQTFCCCKVQHYCHLTSTLEHVQTFCLFGNVKKEQKIEQTTLLLYSCLPCVCVPLPTITFDELEKECNQSFEIGFHHNGPSLFV